MSTCMVAAKIFITEKMMCRAGLRHAGRLRQGCAGQG